MTNAPHMGLRIRRCGSKLPVLTEGNEKQRCFMTEQYRSSPDHHLAKQSEPQGKAIATCESMCWEPQQCSLHSDPEQIRWVCMQAFRECTIPVNVIKQVNRQ
jgi:hypothetical protein